MVKEKKIYILGISAFYHDSAAVILEDGEVIAAAQEERFSRKKHDSSFPKKAIRWCLDFTGLSLDELALVSFYDKSLLKLERLLETYYAFAPQGWRSFLLAMPIWIKEKMFIKSLIRKELASIDSYSDLHKLRMIFPEHHLSHAASAFYPSPFDQAAILTLDGVGEWATSTIGYGKGEKIKIIKQINFPHSLGLLYSTFTYYTGFKVNSGEYKLMGLAPYGNPYSKRVKRYLQIVYDDLLDLKKDGSFWLNMKYFNFAAGLKMVKDEKWKKIFKIPPRQPEAAITQEYMDMAYVIQQVAEEILLRMVKYAKKLTRVDKICLAGGVALNCVANGKILQSGLLNDLWVQPAAGDAGGALGSALCGWHIYLKKVRKIEKDRDKMKGSYFGPEFSDIEIERTVRPFNVIYKKYKDFDGLCQKIARVIAQGKIVGWFQGRMEWGPRALGNRSILADARDPKIQKKLNLKIKFRESFRPFAPSVLNQDASDYFELNHCSPYMLLVVNVMKKRRRALPHNYYKLPLSKKLYYCRSDIPAVTHLNYSARVQTVHQETNPKYWQLIKAFKDITGYSLIVNTSFNVRGEPIVCTPTEAYLCFMRTQMDYLVMGNLLIDKKKQQLNYK